MRQILEGSRAIALTIMNIRPGVVSAYPITPQTHIVEDLAKFKSDGKAKYEYVRAESEFAAVSIVEGASATGVRVYTATSSQGLLLMTEVVFNIAGLRLPVVMTCANRGVSAPITIWNDHQDAMTIRDAGWIMLYSENAQEAVMHHILAFKIAEKLKIPVMVNVDGFVLTHTYEPVIIPSSAEIKKFLPDYKPANGEFLDPKNPVTFGAFAAPAHYMEIRQELHTDMVASKQTILDEYELYRKIIATEKNFDKNVRDDNGLFEYYGPAKPKTLLVAMGSMAGTIKDAADEWNKGAFFNSVGILKLKCFRPFPAGHILPYLKRAKNIAIIEKAVSLGHVGPLASEIMAASSRTNANVKSFVVGLGGRDITKEKIKEIIKIAKETKRHNEAIFIG